jgi:hypothetical protein
MQGIHQHMLQAVRCAEQVQLLAARRVAASRTTAAGERCSEPDEATCAYEELLVQADNYAHSLLMEEGFTGMVGMSAAAAAQLKQGLAAGSCGAVLLHRDWDTVTVEESMYAVNFGD